MLGSRKPKLTRHQQAEALARIAQGETLTAIARSQHSHMTISRLADVTFMQQGRTNFAPAKNHPGVEVCFRYPGPTLNFLLLWTGKILKSRYLVGTFLFSSQSGNSSRSRAAFGARREATSSSQSDLSLSTSALGSR